MVQRKAILDDSGTLLMIERAWISKNVMPRKPGVSKVLEMAPRSNSASLDWAGLDWAGLDWAGLDWAGAAAGPGARSNRPGSVSGSSAFNCSVFQRMLHQ